MARLGRKRCFEFVVAAAFSMLAMTVAVAPAGACGGLVGENGTIQLVRTSTLAAYHDGVERYVTSFEFSGDGKEVGSIVPLPDVPSAVERGGSWTLQRLEREVAPPVREFAAASASLAQDAQVLLTTKIDALDITILKGGGDAVGKWAIAHGFLLTPDAPEVLDFYAHRSPIFMAARFDASRAARLGQRTGDGTPIMLTIPTDAPWVPLRILGLGLDPNKEIDADVFLLTDTKPKLLAGGPGLGINRSEPASQSLLTDLRSDVGMSWVPQRMWFTHLPLSATARELHYDLAISTAPHALPSLDDAGISPPAAVVLGPIGHSRTVWPILAGLGVGGLGYVALRHRRRVERHTGVVSG
jgi:hypothetical protein